MIPKETKDKYWEVSEAYFEKFGEYFPSEEIYAGTEEQIQMMEDALRTGKRIVSDINFAAGDIA